ncbi:MAG: adenine deaminase [Bacteroidales bacterium]|nr:adenine deaminase [Bacteroidales bacterium]
MKISGNIIDIFNREIYPVELYIKNGIIDKVVRSCKVYKKFLLPGFIDAHVHIESSMVVPSAFAEIAIKHGTVAVVADPHEIGNVLGISGVEYMIDNGNSVPFKFFFGAPSCVPATAFESSGAIIDERDIKKLLSRNDVKFLAEMMNYPGVINDDIYVRGKIDIAKKLGKRIDGHAPGVVGENLIKYAKSGITTDHECSDMDEARFKLNQGMKVLIREGSAARNLSELHPLLKEDPENVMLCCDDIHPEMLVDGHINKLVKYLIDKGYDLFDVLRAATVNPVEHYDLEVGLLREGEQADFIVVDDPGRMNVLETWIRGKKVYGDGKIYFTIQKADRVNKFNSSSITVDSIRVKNRTGRINVIDVKDGELHTTSFKKRWSEGRFVDSSLDDDILKIVVKERYNDLSPAVAFVRGFGLKKGAFAGSVAHDSHNIIAVGTDDEAIVSVINRVVKMKGGLAATDGGLIAEVPLPIAGIMSDVPCGTIAEQYLHLSDMVKDMGSQLKAPFMTLSFMALLVIPEIKLGDRGLFDGNKFEFIDLFSDERQKA